MRISFKINREYDNELIKQLEKFKCNNNLSQLIRKILRDNLVNVNNNEIEDVFAEDTKNIETENTIASTTENVKTETIEIRQINKKAEINNTNTDNKSKAIKWNIPK